SASASGALKNGSVSARTAAASLADIRPPCGNSTATAVAWPRPDRSGARAETARPGRIQLDLPGLSRPSPGRPRHGPPTSGAKADAAAKRIPAIPHVPRTAKLWDGAPPCLLHLALADRWRDRTPRLEWVHRCAVS